MKIKQIKITFLGTGTSQGVPVIGCHCPVCTSKDPRNNRLRTSVAVQINGNTFVIDTSMDFRQQMLRAKIEDITAVIYTHEHRDHTGGLDDLRAYNYFLNRPIDLYCTQTVADSLKTSFDYAFAENPYPGVPELSLHIIDNNPFSINGIDVVPIHGSHYVFDVFGYRFGDFAYLTDFNSISDEELVKLYGVKVLVINALRRKEHLSHFTLSQALEVVERVGPQKAYLTHLSHQMGLAADVERELPENVSLAYDGLELNIE